MKYLLTMLIFGYFPTESKIPLGQTREYIIKSNNECYIQVNKPSSLILNCDGFIYMYLFNEETKLCDFEEYEMPISMEKEFPLDLVKWGYEYYGIASKVPSLGVNSIYTPGVMYTNKEIVITIVNSDMFGQVANKISVIVEKYNK